MILWSAEESLKSRNGVKVLKDLNAHFSTWRKPIFTGMSSAKHSVLSRCKDMMMVTALPQSCLLDLSQSISFPPKNEEVQKQRCSLLKMHPDKSGISMGFIPELCKKKQTRSRKSWEILLGNVFLAIPRICSYHPRFFRPYMVELEYLVFHACGSLTSGRSHWFQWNCPLTLQC